MWQVQVFCVLQALELHDPTFHPARYHAEKQVHRSTQDGIQIALIMTELNMSKSQKDALL